MTYSAAVANLQGFYKPSNIYQGKRKQFTCVVCICTLLQIQQV